MKKLLVLFLLMFLNPLFASGIDANATDASCDNTTLETYSGTANVEINWIPNTIQTRWYDGNTLIDTTNTNAASCEYDDVLNVPPTPTARTGYTFTGWTVRPEIDFATTIPTNESGLERFGKGFADGALWCLYNDGSQTSAWRVSCNSDDFKELQQYEWKVKFSHGILYGMSRCSITSGERGQTGNPTEDIGENCWCKATGYKATNSNTISAPSSVLSWVFYSHGMCAVGIGGCRYDCPNVCAASAFAGSSFRGTLFSPAN